MEVNTMACIHREKLHPEEVAAIIHRALTSVATRRNKEKPDHPEIYATQQTDDPNLPNVVKIDVDFPTENDAVRNKYLCHLEIDTKTGELAFRPLDTMARENAQIYPITDYPYVLRLMESIIWTH